MVWSAGGVGRATCGLLAVGQGDTGTV
jgi:hypothetical protein